MARKPNYDFEKRRKEMDRQAKKDAKREERARRKREGITDEPGDVADEDAAEQGAGETVDAAERPAE